MSGHSRGLRSLCGLGIGACFFSAAALTTWLIDAGLPFPSVPEISPRFRYFAEHKDAYDTIFIGSSRVRHQVIPQELDNATAAQGVGTQSFNLGYSGMWPPESYYYLRRILALRPRKLRWVLIELMNSRFGPVEESATTMRSVYWHDARHTWMAWRLVTESPLPDVEKLSLFAWHAKLFFQRMANVGRGAEWLQERYFPSRKKSEPAWIKRGGFDPEEETKWSEDARADYARKVRAFEQARAAGHVPRALASALREMADEVHRAGAEPVFILPPTVRAEEHLSAGLPPELTVWEFDDPARYPRLYLPELHYDSGHLSEAGAREFTDLLAQHLVELARKH